MHKHMNAYMYMCINACICRGIYTYIYTYILYIYNYVHQNIHKYIRIYIHILYIYILLYIYIHTYAHANPDIFAAFELIAMNQGWQRMWFDTRQLRQRACYIYTEDLVMSRHEFEECSQSGAPYVQWWPTGLTNEGCYAAYLNGLVTISHLPRAGEARHLSMAPLPRKTRQMLLDDKPRSPKGKGKIDAVIQEHIGRRTGRRTDVRVDEPLSTRRGRQANKVRQGHVGRRRWRHRDIEEEETKT